MRNDVPVAQSQQSWQISGPLECEVSARRTEPSFPQDLDIFLHCNSFWEKFKALFISFKLGFRISACLHHLVLGAGYRDIFTSYLDGFGDLTALEHKQLVSFTAWWPQHAAGVQMFLYRFFINVHQVTFVMRFYCCLSSSLDIHDEHFY